MVDKMAALLRASLEWLLSAVGQATTIGNDPCLCAKCASEEIECLSHDCAGGFPAMAVTSVYRCIACGCVWEHTRVYVSHSCC